MTQSERQLKNVMARYRRHLNEWRDSRRPSELAVLLRDATPSERADLEAMISRHDAWDQV
jgi:hypothetical protein